MRISFIVFLLFPFLLPAQIEISKVQGSAGEKFAIVSKSTTARIYYSSKENALIQRAAGFLASDIEMVTGQKPEVTTAFEGEAQNLIIVGSVGNNDLIDELVNSKKLDITTISGQWERFLIQTIKEPFPGVEEALVIVGSDRRGTAYGVFTISEAIGVSPWYWWADAPVKKSAELFIQNTRFVSKAPSVKYRGIFINDEAPALRNWAQEKFGGFNHQFYEKVFELILRNKGNYLWPAMWVPSAFADDDPENARLADEYGIVISTSHHEPMMRAHAEWYRFKGGEWNYNSNKEKLQEFWRGGVERMGDFESVVTLGMRGDGDEAMTEETAVGLLTTIIADQRKILTEVSGKPVEQTPQVWAIYKEVQDYYDKGMRVDDDILVLFCDDNWGNVRILPKKEDLDRKGGFGMYYHFDFVGGPVSYRWLNVTQIERVWEQMNLAYEWGVEDLWIVNVGDIKPMELPISFFLDFAWDADIDARDLPGYYVRWATQQFGAKYAEEIAEVLSLYTKYNARRTPEMLTYETYSLQNYREADLILEEYRQLLQKSQRIYAQLPETHKSAFYQLVLSPVELCSNLNEMYIAAGKNKKYLDLGGSSANYYADKVKELFLKDAELTRKFHEDLEGGKWNHMMAQTHIGYTSWNNPPVNKMPAVAWVQPGKAPQLGYVVEYGAKIDWSRFDIEGSKVYNQAFLPFDPVNDQNFYIEVYNKGAQPMNYSITSKNDWVKVSKETGVIQFEEKVYVSIDWNKAPKGRTIGEVVVSGEGSRPFVIGVPVWNELPEVSGFVENNGVLSIEAVRYSNKVETPTIGWTVIPNMGRTNSAITIEPANAEPQVPGEKTPCLEYEFTVFEGGDLKIDTYLSPTLNYKKNEGLKFAIAIDGEAPQIINMHKGEVQPDWEYPAWWNNSVTDHIKKKRSLHTNIKPGIHTLKVWMIDSGVVFQKFVIDADGLRDSYLGPPESEFVPPKF